MKNKININGLKFPAHIGVPDAERAHPQLLKADIVLELDFEQAMQTDSIEDTVDYMKVIESVCALSSNRKWKLLESLASDIAGTIFLHCPPVQKVKLTIFKNVSPLADDVSVQISVSRGDGDNNRKS